MDDAREIAQAEDRSVAQVLLRWMKTGRQAEAQGMGSEWVRGEGRFSDAGAGTEKGAGEKKSRSVPVARGAQADEDAVDLAAERGQAPSGADKAPGPSADYGQKNSVACAGSGADYRYGDEILAEPPPRIRIGSGLHGGESFDHRHIIPDPNAPVLTSGHGPRWNPEAQTIDPMAPVVFPPDWAQKVDDFNRGGIPFPPPCDLPDGVACEHPGCLSHLTHPCEGCGRVGGKFNPYSCADCRAAMKHAYSDATTPGFFYDRCEKHRVLPVETPDIRNAVGVVTTEEMTIEEAKRRFPGVEIGAPDAKTDTRREPSPTSTGTREKIAPVQTRTPTSRVQSGRKGGSKSSVGRLDNRESSRQRKGVQRGKADRASDSRPAQAKLPAKDLAKKIPGVAVAAEVASPKRCSKCGGKLKLFTGTKLRCADCGGIEMK